MADSRSTPHASRSRRQDSRDEHRSSSKHRDRDRDRNRDYSSRRDRERERERDREHHSHLRRHESERRSSEDHHRSDSKRRSPHRSRTTDQWVRVRSPQRSGGSVPPSSRRSGDDKNRDRDRDRGYTPSRHDDRGRSEHKGSGGGVSRHKSVPTRQMRGPVARTVSVWTDQTWASPDVAFERWEREEAEKKRMKEQYQQQKLVKKGLKREIGRDQSSASMSVGSSSKGSVKDRFKAMLGF